MRGGRTLNWAVKKYGPWAAEQMYVGLSSVLEDRGITLGIKWKDIGVYSNHLLLIHFGSIFHPAPAHRRISSRVPAGSWAPSTRSAALSSPQRGSSCSWHRRPGNLPGRVSSISCIESLYNMNCKKVKKKGCPEIVVWKAVSKLMQLGNWKGKVCNIKGFKCLFQINCLKKGKHNAFFSNLSA